MQYNWCDETDNKCTWRRKDECSVDLVEIINREIPNLLSFALIHPLLCPISKSFANFKKIPNASYLPGQNQVLRRLALKLIKFGQIHANYSVSKIVLYMYIPKYTAKVLCME